MGKVNIRSCLIASVDRALICGDFSGQEVRVLAHVCKEPILIDAFLNNKDPHLAIANKFYKLNIPEECLVTTHSEYENVKSKYKDERYNAKIINFSIAYGKSSHGFALDWGWPLNKAKQFIDEYFNTFPNIRKAINKCNQKTRQQKAIRNLTGRIRRFEWVDNAALRQAFNFLIQGCSADLTKLAAGNVRQLCLKHPEWKCLLCLQVHDELVFEIKKEYVKEALPLIKQAMEYAGEQAKLCIPMVVDINFGDNYQEAKP